MDDRLVHLAPVSGTDVPRFAGVSTFFRAPSIERVGDYGIAVIGVPFDGGTSYRPGARFGPNAVRTASRHLRPGFHPELAVSPFELTQVVDAGDVTMNPFDITEAITQIQGYASEVIGKGSGIVSVGGDHSIALPLLRAVNARYGPVALVHFDAHLDTWDTYFGASLTHGTVFRRAFEEGLLIGDHSVHVGIRGPLYRQQDLEDDKRFGFEVISSSELQRVGLDTVRDRVIRRVGDCPVYLSVDIDVLDPAFAPGTGTPESGGLTSRELLFLIRSLDDLAIVASDVVEVCPAYDSAEVTSLAAATVVFDLITLMAKRRSNTAQ